MLGRNPNVAGEREFKSARDRRTVDRCNDRLGGFQNGLVQETGDVGGQRDERLLRVVGFLARLEIGTGAEGEVANAGQHDYANLGIDIGVDER